MATIIKRVMSTSTSAAAVVMMMAVLMMAMVLEGQAPPAQGTCTEQLTNLNVCAPYLVPGNSNGNPNSQCCNALQSVDRDCICNTIRMASRLPAQCNFHNVPCDTS